MEFINKHDSNKRLFANFVLVFLLSLIAFTLSEVSAENTLTQRKEFQELRIKAAEEGKVPVIVGLKLPQPGFEPEGVLSSQEVKKQRDAIAATRMALLNSLTGYDVVVYRIYNSLPYVAMKVGVDSLKELENSPYVTTIQEDLPRGLHETGGQLRQRKAKF
ncbi:MAG: hypothetical protein U9R57_17550 [Thermodesulfobacteriota bacterium]|nr:hypothetical protein [Thermodesulfobacteriota bacterium]